MSFRVAYIAEEFPKLSETFIIEELNVLMAENAISGIFSLSRPKRPSPRYPALTKLTKHPSRGAILKANLMSLLSPWYWKWLIRTLKHYPEKILAFFRGVSFLPELRKAGPDQLHVHFATFASFMTMALAQRLQIPFSMTVHATGIFREKILIQEKCQSAAFVVTISQFNRDYLHTEFGVDREKVELIHCGISSENFQAAREGRKKKTAGNKNGDERTLNILSVGRMVEKKGFDDLIEALSRLEERNWKATIIGGGPLKEQISDLIREKGLEERVSLPGSASDELLLESFAAADIFVLPCTHAASGDLDGIPVVLMESLYTGIPTISTRVSGIPELVIHNETGLLVEEKDPEALAAAMARLMDDEELRKELGEQGHRKVNEEFNIQITAARLHNVMKTKR